MDGVTVRDVVPNNALLCMPEWPLAEAHSIEFFGELAERLKALPC